jgi:DNA-binding response OmpR family regulator
MDPSILVAGKSSQNYDLVKRAFAAADINIVRAPTMSLSLFLAQKNLPFLIIADTDLIDGDATTFLYGLRNDADLKNVPVVFLTNTAVSSPTKRTLVESGATKILSGHQTLEQFQNEIAPFVRLQGKERMPQPDETTE